MRVDLTEKEKADLEAAFKSLQIDSEHKTFTYDENGYCDIVELIDNMFIAVNHNPLDTYEFSSSTETGDVGLKISFDYYNRKGEIGNYILTTDQLKYNFSFTMPMFRKLAINYITGGYFNIEIYIKNEKLSDEKTKEFMDNFSKLYFY